MFKVSAVASEINEQTVEMLETSAEIAGASEVRCLLNGVVALFEDDANAQAFREVCLTSERLRGRMGSLSIVEA